MRHGLTARIVVAAFLLAGAAACETPPWEMPCPEGWVLDAEGECYDPAGDDDSADDDAQDGV